MVKQKALEYEAAEPAFLQRLKAQNAGHGDRHERPIPRPKRAKAEDEEDAPTYVLEESNDTVTTQDYAKLLAAEKTDSDPVGEKVKDPSDRVETAKESSERKLVTTEAGIGQKKRKAAAVVGGEVDEADGKEDVAKPKKTKKKAKPIKLAFDDDAT